MVRSQCAGTAFSIEIGTTFPGIHIACSFGLGESVVSGDVTADEWLVNASSLMIIRQTRGSKRFEYVAGVDQSTSGVEQVINDVCDLCEYLNF